MSGQDHTGNCPTTGEKCHDTGCGNGCKAKGSGAPPRSALRWVESWTRLYDKIASNPKCHTDGKLCNQQSYAFVRMATAMQRRQNGKGHTS